LACSFEDNDARALNLDDLHRRAALDEVQLADDVDEATVDEGLA
jgi:hypothetical protein